MNNAVARIAGLVAIAVVGIAAASGSGGLTTHGFHVAMLITGLLICAGGAIGAVGIRNPQHSNLLQSGCSRPSDGQARLQPLKLVADLPFVEKCW